MSIDTVSMFGTVVLITFCTIAFIHTRTRTADGIVITGTFGDGIVFGGIGVTVWWRVARLTCGRA